MFDQIVPSQNNNDLPLPLLVAEKWNFQLSYHIVENQYWYAIQDWIIGLTNTKNPRQIWSEWKRSNSESKLYNSVLQLPYKAANGRTYQLDFTSDEGLYLIAQYLRATAERQSLIEIQQFLAQAGVFVDEARREPEKLMTALAMDDPDKMVDAVVESYRRQGKTDEWIGARLAGIVARNQFTRALQIAIEETLDRRDYGTATNQIYLGLWERTAEQLKQELGLKKRQNLRDHQPGVALSYQMIAEQVSAHQLGNRQELTLHEGLDIIGEVAEIIGQQAAQTAKLMGMDLATGKALLK